MLRYRTRKLVAILVAVDVAATTLAWLLAYALRFHADVIGSVLPVTKGDPETIELGEAFLAQDKQVMDAIQNLRGKAQKAGTLQTTPQQIVTVTNLVVEKTVDQQVVW